MSEPRAPETRAERVSRLREDRIWDVVVIGGGATGLGVAVEAASRDYSTLLVEQSDFAKGTSSRSTKLIHGGVRYLQQGNVSLVLEALRERGRLFENAPHLVRNLAFVVPTYDWWEGPFYGIGLKLYDKMAGRLGLGASRHLSREETLERIPTVEPDGLRGGIVYHDGQFDDARLAVCLARTVEGLGGTALNYVRATGFLREAELIRGIVARDVEAGVDHELRARAVVNATGVFTDAVRRMDDPDATSLLTASQGVHLVLDRTFLPGESAIMVPHTEDGRVLFAVPWEGRVIVGTTDTPVSEIRLEPRALAEETGFLLRHAARYLDRDPGPADVRSVFAGLRPLIGGGGERDTAELSRDHQIFVSPSGLVTITGGKWTTYRRMGQDAVDQAALVGGLEERASVTAGLRLHGWAPAEHPAPPGRPLHWREFGDETDRLEALCRERPELAEPLHPALPYLRAEVVWAARHEMARTLEDVLARRTRALFLDAAASMEAAPGAAALLAGELGRDAPWAEEETAAYRRLAPGYLLPPEAGRS